jgi:enamine deaminase RidA (YjgF/YER057c/UK114 family)
VWQYIFFILEFPFLLLYNTKADMSIEENIAKLGINLPEAPKAAGSYVPAVLSGNLLFTSGILPFKDGKIAVAGRLGEDVTPEEGSRAAEIALLNALAVIKDAGGSLDSVERIVKLTGYVSSAEGFVDQAKILNVVSDLLKKVFGDKGGHARVTVGVSRLPLNAVIELDLVVELRK